MRKLIFRGLLLSLAGFIHQTGSAQVRVGIFAGPQTTSAKYLVNDAKQPTDYKAGLQLGATLKVPFENRLFFAPAIYYSQKGYKVTLKNGAFPPDANAVNNETTIHTIEVAPLLNFDFSTKPSHFFIKVGPAVDFALSGKESFDTRDGKHTDRSMKFSYEDYGLYTAQGIIHFGYETERGWYVFAHYARGFGSLNNADDGPKIFHRIAGLSLGYYLNQHPAVKPKKQ